jgi:hypothetical protein
MNAEHAIELARNFAQGKGYDMSKYETHARKKGPVWKVDFYSKEAKPRPGSYFSVYVDEKTKSVVRLVPGK